MSIKGISMNIRTIYLITFFLPLIYIFPKIFFIILVLIGVLENRYVYYLLSSLSIAVISFRWLPEGEIFDIVRHHATYNSLLVNNFDYFLYRVKTVESPFSILITYILTVFKNANYLQFFVVFLGISLLFKIIHENTKNTSIINRFMIVLVILSSFRLLQFISGLWNILAIILFAYAMLCIDNKKIRIIVYVVCFFIHFSMLVPIVLLIFREWKPRHINASKILLLSIFFICSPYLILYVLSFLYKILPGIDIIYLLKTRFDAYFLRQSNHDYLMNPRYIFLEILKPITVLLMLMYDQGDSLKINKLIDNKLFYIIVLSLLTILIGVQVRILLRFTFLVLILFVPYMNGILAIKKPQRFLLVIFLFGFILIQLTYQLLSLTGVGF